MNGITFGFGCIVALVALPSSAVMVGSSFEKTKNTDITKQYVSGVAEGIRVTSLIYEMRGAPPVFCPPDDISLNAEEYLQIFENKYASLPKEMRESGPIEPMIYAALQQEYPCDQKST